MTRFAMRRTMKFHSARTILILAVSVLLACAVRVGLAQAQEGSGGQPGGDLIFTTPPTFSDGQVSAQFLVRSADMQRYDLLTAANFQVSEAADSLQVSTEPSAPMLLEVMVNLSFASDVDLIQGTLSAYFDNYYRPGDEVIFFIQGPFQFETREPADLDAIHSLIASLAASPTYTAIDNGMVSSALDRLRAELDENPNRAFQALLVASYFMATDNPTFGRSFAALNVPLNVVQAHRFRADTTPQMRALAENGGGLFVDNREGRFIQNSAQNGAAVVAVSTLRLAYDALDSSRTIYTLTYHPLRRDLVTQPDVTLTLQLDANRRIGAEFSYQRVFAPPQLDLSGDTLDLSRTPGYQGSQVVFDSPVRQLRARIQFPDAIPRRIDSVRVELTNTATDQVLQSVLQLQPEVDPLGYFNVTYSLQDFTLPDTTTPIRITLTVTDELGMNAAASLDGRVTVVALPASPTPIPSPTFTPVPTATVVPTLVPTTAPPTPAAVGSASTASAVSPTTPAFENPVVLLFTGIIALLVLIIILMLIRQRQLRRRQTTGAAGMSASASGDPMGMDTDMGQPSPSPSANGSAQAQPPASAPPEENKLYGRLIIVRGLNEAEILITRQEFVIGRSETDHCDYVIPSPYISPRHCMIVHRNGKFAVRDLKSKNGVFVNGERIPVERDVIVPIGSEVGITQNIVVELWDPNTQVSERRSRQTTTSQTSATQSRITGTDFLFRAVPGIRYVDDEEAVDDDYSPI